MKVKCILNTGIAFNDYTMPIGYSGTSEFGVRIGTEYIVMGILLCEGLLMYLIDDGGMPLFYPFQLFEIIDEKWSNVCYFKAYVIEDGNSPYRQAVWGYEELMDDSYLDKLLDLDSNALQIYYKRKNEFRG